MLLADVPGVARVKKIINASIPDWSTRESYPCDFYCDTTYFLTPRNSYRQTFALVEAGHT